MLEKLIALHLFMTTKRDEEKGATATEYALLVAFIAIAIVAAVTAFGGALGGFFDRITDRVDGWGVAG